MSLEYSYKRFITDTETGITKDISKERFYSDKAFDLAKAPYSISIVAEQLEDGRYIWVAKHSEWDACMAQGDTQYEALLSLDSVRLDMIEYCLEKGLEIPKPKLYEDIPF